MAVKMSYKIIVETKIYGNDDVKIDIVEYKTFYFSLAKRIYIDFISEYLDKYLHNEFSSCTIQLIKYSDKCFNILYQWKI